MKTNFFGYLLVTPNSVNQVDAISKDYWNSIAAMELENKIKKKNYTCLIVCIDCSWWFRRKLAKKIGIPMSKIYNAKYLKSPANRYRGFDIVVTTDSMADDTFYGKTKVYDTPENIPKEDIFCSEVVYAV